MIAKFWFKIKNWFLRSVQIQLFVSLIGLPILVWWGLPISLLSIAGNLLFGPVLLLFLFFSSLLFFTELAHIPNGAIAWCLEQSTFLWLWLIKSEGALWLFGFAKPSVLLLLFIFLAAAAILHYKKFTASYQSIVCFAVLLLGSCLFIKLAYTKTNAVEMLPCNRGHVTLIHDKKQLVVIDPGVIGQRISANSWIEFTFISHLIKTSGKTKIDHLIVLQPGAVLFDALATLISKLVVKKIYLVVWQGSLTKREWARFFAFRRAAQAKGISIERIAQKEIILELSNASKISIKPLPKTIRQKDITYPAVEVVGSCGATSFAVHSQKYKPRKSAN